MRTATRTRTASGEATPAAIRRALLVAQGAAGEAPLAPAQAPVRVIRAGQAPPLNSAGEIQLEDGPTPEQYPELAVATVAGLGTLDDALAERARPTAEPAAARPGTRAPQER